MAHTKRRTESCGVGKLNKKVIKKGFADMTNDFACSVEDCELMLGLVIWNVVGGFMLVMFQK